MRAGETGTQLLICISIQRIAEIRVLILTQERRNSSDVSSSTQGLAEVESKRLSQVARGRSIRFSKKNLTSVPEIAIKFFPVNGSHAAMHAERWEEFIRQSSIESCEWFCCNGAVIPVANLLPLDSPKVPRLSWVVSTSSRRSLISACSERV
jgi:hypothetical protein